MKILLILVASLLLSLCQSLYAATFNNYEQLLQTHLKAAHTEGCSPASSELAQILCQQRIRIGVRYNYRFFGEFEGGEFKGFEVDLAKLIAKQLGVAAEFHPVTATNRIEKLLNFDIDAIIATMAHTIPRDAIIHFVRPHYYSSSMSIVSTKENHIAGWQDLANKTVCVPLGNFSNIVFSQNQVKLLIYNEPKRLIEALRLGVCKVIAHDRSLLEANVFGKLAPKELTERFEEKIAFDEVPWGIGVLKKSEQDLGVALSLIMAQLHQNGTLEKLASQYSLNIQFLTDQQVVWARQECLEHTQLNSACQLQAANVVDRPTPIAETVLKFENWIQRHTELLIKFPMLSGKSAAKLFLTGLIVSIFLVAGSVVLTLVVAMLFFNVSRHKNNALRYINASIVYFFQYSPVILLLFLGYLTTSYVTSYSPFLAVFVAIIIIGLNNGASGCSAMREFASLLPNNLSTKEVALKTSTQLRAAVINAAKASPVAGFIGAPEMLAVLTDITSFSGERITTFIILIIFYIALIQAVVSFSYLLVKKWRH